MEQRLNAQRFVWKFDLTLGKWVEVPNGLRDLNINDIFRLFESDWECVAYCGETVFVNLRDIEINKQITEDDRFISHCLPLQKILQSLNTVKQKKSLTLLPSDIATYFKNADINNEPSNNWIFSEKHLYDAKEYMNALDENIKSIIN